MNVPDYVERNARLYPDKTAIAFEGRSCTFKELQERVYRLANGLLHLGVEKGERIAIFAENCFEYPEMYFAIPKAGAVAAPLNYRFAPPEASHLINDAGAKVFIFQDRYLELVNKIKGELSTVETYICLGETPQGMVDYDDLLASSPTTNPGIGRGPDDLYCLIHTGGTTGLPKLAMLSHKALYSCALLWIIDTGSTYGDVHMIVTPLYHTASIWPLFWHLMLGNTQVILRRVDVEEMLKTIERERITHSMWMSSIITTILNHPSFMERKYDLSSLRLLTTGGAPLAEPMVRKLIAALPGILITSGGGQTEAGAFSMIRYHEEIAANTPSERFGSAGKVGINMELKIVDENDNELPPGQVGELVVRGDGLMLGYWNKPEETAHSMRGGWQHTGDLCKVDEDGYLYYVDRLKDMIKSGGENVYSKEVEDALYLHPAIAEAAVIGVHDEKWGEAVKALVVLREREKATEEEVIAHCKTRIASYKCPKSVEFRHSLPKTALGKVNKPELRKEYR
jgi:long-chain acyl-CoA synthetase